ncbi:hypothetical protein [Aeromonas sp. MdU4]|uniref:hypothetical protein n=1 Tax=Aeromonas sp. MdU4 TaxID=3342819 RepID=UPI0035B9F8D2
MNQLTEAQVMGHIGATVPPAHRGIEEYQERHANLHLTQLHEKPRLTLCKQQ